MKQVKLLTPILQEYRITNTNNSNSIFTRSPGLSSWHQKLLKKGCFLCQFIMKMLHWKFFRSSDSWLHNGDCRLHNLLISDRIILPMLETIYCRVLLSERHSFANFIMLLRAIAFPADLQLGVSLYVFWTLALLTTT